MKTCIKCKNEYPATLEYFHKSSQSTTGLIAKCKSCRNSEVKVWNSSEKKKETNRRWQSQNKEKVNKINKRWRDQNKDVTKELWTAWYEKNKESQIAKSKLWVKNNPEKARANWAKRSLVRRARRNNNGCEVVTKEQIFEAYGTNCYLCDMPINLQVSGRAGSNPQWRSGLHIEHFIADANGGPTTLENLRPSHAWCNLAKGVA